MKKTLFILTAMLLFIGAAFAQPRAAATKADMPKPESTFLTAVATYAPIQKGRAVLLSEGFESGSIPSTWLNLDVDGDSYKWATICTGSGIQWQGHNSTYAAGSGSYIDPPGPGNVDPDNWLISPRLLNVSNAELTYWVAVNNAAYPAERYQVLVSTTGTNPATDFTVIHSEILTAAAGGYNYTIRTLNLSAYNGQNIYIAFRNYYDSDMFTMVIDDIQVTGESGPGPGDCDPATNFAATYIDGCKAKLTWSAPAKSRSIMLWDNTSGMGTSGFHGTRWMGGTDALLQADDFIIPAGETWQIQEVYFYGFPSGSAGSPQPEHIGVIIYTNDNNKPSSTVVYENNDLIPTGGIVNGDMTIVLPTAVQISTPGKYWITIYGAYTGATNTSKQYYVADSPTLIESMMCRWDPGNLYGTSPYYPNWAPNETVGQSSMAFTLKGEKGGTPPPENSFNIYRDGGLVKENLNALTYTDEGFDASVGHTWEVKVICTPSGESAPVSQTLPACDEGDCPPPSNLTANYVNGCTEGVLLEWNKPAKAIEQTAIFSDNNPSLETLKNVAPAERTQTTMGTTTYTYDTKGNRGGAELLNESFTAGTLPAGWLNVDVDGDGYKWQFEVYGSTAPYPPMPSEGHNDTYSINSASYYNGIGALSPNNWLITPQLELTGNTELTYWVKAIDASYSQDHYGVYVSTTGTNPSDFTLVFEETLTPANANWTPRTVNIPQAGNCYIAFRHFSSYDIYIMCLDDIIVTAADPIFYNIYRDDVLLKGNHPTTSYTDTDVDPTAAHKWEVKVACDVGGESAGISKNLEACFTCEPPSNLAVAIAENCTTAELTWKEPVNPPAGFEGWAKHCVSDEVKGRLGYSETSGADMTPAIRFTPSDLSALGVSTGMKITKVALGIGSDMDKVNTMEIRIWEGGTSVTNAGTLKYSQPITNYATFTPNAMNEVTLTTPFVIDASKELRIGYQLVNTAGYPIGRDAGPVVAEKGDLFYLNGSWMVTSQAISGWNYNFTIKAWVEGEATTLYNIYRNAALIKANHAGTSYSDAGLAVNTSYTWSVAVVCGGGLESELISKDGKTCVGVNEHAKTTFSIVPNPATSGTITITSGTNFNSVEMISFLGQTVLSQPNVGNTTTVDVSNLPSGVYFVRLISEQGISVQKFVKQ